MRVLAFDGIGGDHAPLAPVDATGRRMDVALAPALDAALEQLDGGRFDAIVLRERLDAVGMGVLAAAAERAPSAAIIMVVPPEFVGRAADAVRDGAQDVLVDGRFDGAELGRALAVAVERQRLHNELRGLTLVDELTSLYNRRGFMALALAELRLANRMRHAVAQLFIDLDGLKDINDTLGHVEGDRALVETAELLRSTFRDSDVIARLSGDEFAVLVVDAREPAPEVMVRRLREQLAERNLRPGRRWTLSLSVGMATYDPSAPCTVEELMARADAWMYAQKREKHAQRQAAGVR
ncbi:MAG: GGDEF domain-containing protein [Gemmatimonadaceae bacterium]